MNLKIDKKILKLLMETGFLSADIGRLEKAEDIFLGIAKVRPGNINPEIGLAYVDMGRQSFEKAISRLKKAIQTKTTDTDLCKSFLGMAFKLAKYEEQSQNILTEVINNGQDKVAVNLAKSLLNESISVAI